MSSVNTNSHFLIIRFLCYIIKGICSQESLEPSVNPIDLLRAGNTGDNGWRNIIKPIQGVPKKTHVLGILVITPLWNWLGTKVGCVLKNSGNSLFDRHQNFLI